MGITMQGNQISQNGKRGIRRLDYFSGCILLGLLFALPCAWLEGENAPLKIMPYLFIYGLYGLLAGLLIEKRAKNIGFNFKQTLSKPDAIGPVTGSTVMLFLLLGLTAWIDVTGEYSDSIFLIPVAILLLISAILAIPISLYLLFAPENHGQSFGIRHERRKLEKELKCIKEANEIERLKQEIKRLKDETP